MGELAIQVEQLGKQYRLGARPKYRALRDTLTDWLNAPARALAAVTRGRQTTAPAGAPNSFWALKDVSFEVQRGEVIGIIGRNGAGKSTLLKILSRVTRPTEGHARIYGRVSSLLEVGTGFHPELTGRENIYLNGTILGMKRYEIVRKFDEIVAFSEIEKFIDTPVKHYSSGMYTRLAFAVAAHLEPEILMVDEVLAVGDAAFQKKCLGKMGEVAQEGRTVFFVSHNMAAIENLCQHGMLLKQGRIDFIGSQAQAIARYLANDEQMSNDLQQRTDRVGSGTLRVVNIQFRDMLGAEIDTLTSGQDVDVCLYYETLESFRGLGIIVSIVFKNALGTPLFLQHNRMTGDLWSDIPRRGVFICRLKRVPLPSTAYHVEYSVLQHGDYLDRMENAIDIAVVDGDFYGTGEVPPVTHGLCLVDAAWRVETVRA